MNEGEHSDQARRSEGGESVFGGKFRAERLLKRGQGVDTWRGRDLGGGEVVIKTISTATTFRAARKWLEFELDVLNDLGQATTAVPIHTATEDATLSLTRPFIHGPTLREQLAGGPGAIRDVIALAISLFDTLDKLHTRGIVHGDIKPSNIVLAKGSWSSPVLVDFGLARHELLSDALDQIAIESVGYLAPEQAGLIKRGIDARADLYAVGLTLYEAVARPPFSGQSVSELLRYHLTATPHPLQGVPGGFERIVTRLLRKDPRDRYQTAAGVLRDLQQLSTALERGQADAELVVGAHDPRDSITEPAFTGRTDELATLATALAEARAGRGGLALVEGQSGSGKTWLLEELGKRALQQEAWVLRSQGLAGVAPHPLHVLSAMARDMASTAAPGSSRALRLVERAGSAGPSIADALPPLRGWFDSAADASIEREPGAGHEALEVNAEERSLAALSGLLDALGSELEPAVVLVDDAQWADALTLRLFERWQATTRAEGRHVLVVLTFRSEDVDQAHPLRRMTPGCRVDLGPFRDDEVRQQIASMAGAVPEKVIELVIQHAAGNPFLTSATLHGLVESNVLVHAAGGWQLAERALKELQVSGRIAELLTTRIAGLEPDVRRLLAASALLGRTFDPVIAGELCGLAPRDVMPIIHQLRGRLLWFDGTAWSFVHDRIRDALLADLADDARRRLHLEAAQRLEKSSDHEFELAYHYDAAGEPARALPHALEAAERARTLQDMELAERYYRIAARGLADDTEPSTRYRVARGLGDVLLIRSSYQDCERYLDEAFRIAPDHAARADIEERRAQLALKKGDLPGAIQHGEQALRLVGRYVPRSGLMCTLIVLWEVLVQILHTRFPKTFVGRRPIDGADDEMFAIRVYNSLNGPYFFARGVVWVSWAHLRALNLSERYPPSRALGREYGVHGSACAGFPSLFERAIRYTRRGAELCAERGDLWGQARCLQFLALNLCATGRYREAVEAGEQGGRLFDLAGDAWEAQGALNWASLARYRMGDLAGAAESAQRLYERGRRLDAAHGIAFAVDAWVRAVEGRLPAKLLQDELGRGQQHVQTSSIVAQAEAIRLLAHGQPADAEKLIETWLRRMREERAFFHESNVSLIVYLAAAQRQRAEVVAQTDPEQSARILEEARRTARRALKKTRKFRNCVPHALREAAVIEAMAGSHAEARALIDASVDAAEQLGARFELALSREVRGELGPTLRGSRAARDLESARSELAAMRAQLAEAPLRVTVSLIDRFDAVLAAGHQIARSLVAEDVIAALRRGAVSLLRAQRCSMVERDSGADHVRVVHGDAGPISSALVHAATESRQVAVWPSVERPLEADETLVRAAVRSALCAPISVRGRVAQLLYLTHSDVGSAFGDEERKIAGFLVALAGAALENAEGFLEVQTFSRELERRVEARTAELAAANRALEGSLHQLEDSQEQLLHAGRMAAVGTLIAGLSHELNNPLTVIVGNVENLRELGGPDERLDRLIDAIERQAKRAARLVDALLRFAHSGSVARDVVKPEDMIRLVVDLVSAEARRRQIELRVAVPDDLAEVVVVRHDIESALVNITTNALQATALGGVVELSANAERRSAGAGIRFAVRDTGAGIAPELLPQIFDPFFTTKPPGEGTGLGLSLARQAATAHGGQLVVDSVIGRGTTMTLWLPERHAAPAPNGDGSK